MKTLLIQLFVVLNFYALPNYPTPEKKTDLLFYIQRSLNTNTVIYKANYNDKGWLNTNKPVKVYWLMYEEDEEIEELSLIEKKYAFGIEIEACKNEANTYWMRLNSQKQLPLKIVQYEPFNAKIMVERNNNNTYQLDHIFILSDESGLWPKVKSIELYMHSKDKVKSVHEVIKIN